MIGTGPQPPATHRSASSISRRMTSSSTLVRGSSCASPHPGWFRVSSCPRAGWRRFTSSIHHTLRIHRQQLMLCPSLWARRFTASILLSPTLDRARCTSRAVHLPNTSPSGLISSGPTTSFATVLPRCETLKNVSTDTTSSIPSWISLQLRNSNRTATGTLRQKILFTQRSSSIAISLQRALDRACGLRRRRYNRRRGFPLRSHPPSPMPLCP